MTHHRSRRPGRFALPIIAGLLVAPSVTASVVAGSSLLPYSIIAVPSQADAVRIGDVTGDGLADIVFSTAYVGDPGNDFGLFVLPQAAGGFGALRHYVTAGTYSERPGSLALGDVTGDGRTDVVVGLDRKGIQVFPGQADGTLGAPSFIATVDSTRVAIGTLDGQPGRDVAGIGWGTNTVTVFSGGPSGLVKLATYGAEHGGYDDLEIGDVTGDARDDLVVMSGQGAASSFSIVPQLAGGGFGLAAAYSVGTGPFTLTHGIGIGDVTGDGRNDVVASYGGNSPTSQIAVFAQTAGGLLAQPVSYPSYDVPEPVEVADLDFDGRPEVVTAHGGFARVGVYGGEAGGTLAPETLYPVTYASHYNVQGLAIGDVNGDRSPDVVEADDNAGLVVLLNALSAPAPRAPSAPSLTTVTGGDRSVTATWTAPVSDGGAPITSYTATVMPGGAICVTLATTCTIGGLLNGTTYSVTVHATNSAGSSPESSPLSATARTVPTAPASLTAKAGGTGIALKWLVPSANGGASITAYRVYRGTSSTSGVQIATVSASALSFVDTTAPKKTTSYYWVTAVNAAGESARSNVASAKR